MPLYPTGPSIRPRSIAEIARGKLHHYGIETIPHNPYASGSLRHLFRTSSIRRNSDSAEQRHLKSEAERLEFKYPKIMLPTYEDAKETKALTVSGVHFKFNGSTNEFASDDGTERIPLGHFETRFDRKRRNDLLSKERIEQEIDKDMERQAKEQLRKREEDSETGGPEDLES